jgi:hypothetical protein
MRHYIGVSGISAAVFVCLVVCASCTQATVVSKDAGRDAADAWIGELGPPCAPGALCDRDGDGVFDGDEDFNGDGLLGCCIEGACGKAAATQSDCILNHHGCGGDQRCVAGRCTPPRDRSCSRGELDPTKPDTFGDGTPDGQRDNFVCHAHPPAGKPGPKQLQIVRNASANADWALGLEPQARYRELALNNARDKEAAAAIDYPADQLAGFVISLPVTQKDLLASKQVMLNRIYAAVGPGDTVSVRASGTKAKSHDRYDQIAGTIVDLSLKSSSTVSELRRRIVAALLGRAAAQLGATPPAFGAPETDFVLRMSLVRRFAFARDAKGELDLDWEGFPREDLAVPEARRLLIIGGVAPRRGYQDPALTTGFRLDDLSGGQLLAHADAQTQVRCEVGGLRPHGSIDFIWVVDEAALVAGHRDRVVRNAHNFLMRALAMGVNARFCVIGALDPKGPQAALAGRCCQPRGGTGERLLEMSQLDDVLRCVKNPPGEPEARAHGFAAAEAAIAMHLPRADDPAKIRPWARLSVVQWTHRRDARSLSLLDPRRVPASQCKLAPLDQAALTQLLRPTLEARQGQVNPEAASAFHLIGGVCGNRCGATVNHDYHHIARQRYGVIGDICADDLGYTLSLLIDLHIHSRSPIQLDYWAIPHSLRLVLAGEVLERSRTKGFDYRPWMNSLAFIGVRLERPSTVTLSYRHWLPR